MAPLGWVVDSRYHLPTVEKGGEPNRNTSFSILLVSLFVSFCGWFVLSEARSPTMLAISAVFRLPGHQTTHLARWTTSRYLPPITGRSLLLRQPLSGSAIRIRHVHWFVDQRKPSPSAGRGLMLLHSAGTQFSISDPSLRGIVMADTRHMSKG